MTPATQRLVETAERLFEVIPVGVEYWQEAEALDRAAAAVESETAEARPLPADLPPAPWTYLERRTLIHIETAIDNATGAGVPICSVPRNRLSFAEWVVNLVNGPAQAQAQQAISKALLDEIRNVLWISPTDLEASNHTGDCAVCSGAIKTREGCEPTEQCDLCAQEIVHKLRQLFSKHTAPASNSTKGEEEGQ